MHVYPQPVSCSWKWKWDLFRLFPPLSLVGAYHLHPRTHVPNFYNDLSCNETCSVTGGAHNVLGVANGKEPKIDKCALGMWDREPRGHLRICQTISFPCQIQIRISFWNSLLKCSVNVCRLASEAVRTKIGASIMQLEESEVSYTVSMKNCLTIIRALTDFSIQHSMPSIV